MVVGLASTLRAIQGAPVMPAAPAAPAASFRKSRRLAFDWTGCAMPLPPRACAEPGRWSKREVRSCPLPVLGGGREDRLPGGAGGGRPSGRYGARPARAVSRTALGLPAGVLAQAHPQALHFLV